MLGGCVKHKYKWNAVVCKQTVFADRNVPEPNHVVKSCEPRPILVYKELSLSRMSFQTLHDTITCHR